MSVTLPLATLLSIHILGCFELPSSGVVTLQEPGSDKPKYVELLRNERRSMENKLTVYYQVSVEKIPTMREYEQLVCQIWEADFEIDYEGFEIDFYYQMKSPAPSEGLYWESGDYRERNLASYRWRDGFGARFLISRDESSGPRPRGVPARTVPSEHPRDLCKKK